MTERTRFTAYITKYLFTYGIQEIQVEDCFDISATMVRDPRDDRRFNCYHKNEWFRSLDEAVRQAKKMQAEKIDSLHKQIDRISKMVF